MFHVKHGCEIMIYGDVIQKLIMNESIIDDNKLNLAFYKIIECISDIKIEFGIDTLVLKYLNIYVSRETLFATYTLHKMKIKSEIYNLKYLRVSKNE